MVWPFGKSKSNGDMDALINGQWTCTRTGSRFRGLTDLAARAPDAWQGSPDYEPNSAIRLDKDFLSEDFCVMTGSSGQTNYLVRCVLPITVDGLEEGFAYGCWGTLKRENFELYLDHFDSGTVPETAPFFSWLCNDLKPFDLKRPIECSLQPRAHRQRPVLTAIEEGHPLTLAQQNGISAARLIEIYAAYGYELA